MQWSFEERARLVLRIAHGEVSVTSVVQYENVSAATVKTWVEAFLHAAPDCFDETMMGRLVAQGLASDEHRTQQSGRIEEVQPLDLLQSLGLYRKPGHVLFFHAHGTSQLWFEDGQVIDAQSGGLKGAAAVYRIVGHETGDFRVEVTGVHRPHAIELSGTALIMESARRLDETKRLAAGLPGSDVILYCTLNEAPSSMSPAEISQRVIAGLASGGTIGEVLERSPFGELETLEYLAELSRSGQLRPTDETRRPELPSVQRRARALREVALEMSQQVVPTALAQSMPVRGSGRSWAQLLSVGLFAAAVTGAVGFGLLDRGGDEVASASAAASPETTPAAPLAVGTPAMPGLLAGSNSVCPPDMILMPSTELQVGRDADAKVRGAAPAHPVEISGFCIDRHEVTMAEYRSCSDAGDCKRAHRDAEWSGGRARERKAKQKTASVLCNERRDGVDDHPVNCVTWAQADAYCRHEGKTLPTEAQWERAARGQSDRRYPWGDASPGATRVNACGAECRNGADTTGDGFVSTAPVGSFPEGATPRGVEDLAGNVREWTADGYYRYSTARSGDPRGPASADNRVVRGGGFSSTEHGELDVARRVKTGIRDRRPDLGFRCALELAP